MNLIFFVLLIDKPEVKMISIEVLAGVLPDRSYEFCFRGARYEGKFIRVEREDLVFERCNILLVPAWSLGDDYIRLPLNPSQQKFPGRFICDLVQLD